MSESNEPLPETAKAPQPASDEGSARAKLAKLLAEPETVEPGEAGESQQNAAPQAGESKGKPKLLKDVAERLAVSDADLYAIEVPMAEGKTMSLGKLKDAAAKQDDFLVRELAFEERVAKQEAEWTRAQTETQELLSLIDPKAIKPELKERVRQKIEADVKRERALILETIPEWKSETVREAELASMVEYLKDFGIHESFLTATMNHKLFRLVRSATLQKQRMDRALAGVQPVKKPSTTGKAGAPNGAPVRPTTPQKRTQANARERLAQALNERYTTMAQPADSLQFADLTAVTVGGLLNEDVLQKMNDISPRDTPALDLFGGGTFSNPYFTWVQDTLTAPTFASKAVDGGAFAPVTAASGARVGNWGQLSEYGVNVGDVAESSSQIGRSSELAYQTTKRLAELETNIEASVLSNLPSIAGTTSVAAQTAGLGAWLETNTSHGAGGSAGGFNTSTSIVDAPTVGASRQCTWALISARIDAAYLLGAKPSHLVTRPELTKGLGRYLIASDFFVAPVANVAGDRTTEVVPSGYIDMFKTDYGYIMKIVPSRNQQLYDSADTNSTADAVVLFGLDPQWIEIPQMWGTRIKPMSEDGHYKRRMITRHWATRVLLERAHFGIYDLQPSTAVAAS